MKLTKDAIEQFIAASKKSQEKALIEFERQNGAIAFCEYILKNYDFSQSDAVEEDGQNGP